MEKLLLQNNKVIKVSIMEDDNNLKDYSITVSKEQLHQDIERTCMIMVDTLKESVVRPMIMSLRSNKGKTKFWFLITQSQYRDENNLNKKMMEGSTRGETILMALERNYIVNFNEQQITTKIPIKKQNLFL